VYEKYFEIAGQAKPAKKFVIIIGIGKYIVTSRNSPIGYCYRKKPNAVMIAFHPAREATPRRAKAILCQNNGWSSYP